MDSPIIIWWILAGVSSILTAYLIHRNHSEKLRIEEARLKKESPDVNYDYNRFNTKDQRTTNIEISNEQFIIETDMQHVQIANEMLFLRNSSEIVNLGKIRFDLTVTPFIKELISADIYTQSDISGMIIFFAHEPYTSVLLEYLKEVHKISLSLPEDFKNTYLQFNAVITDPADDIVQIKGLFLDGQRWEVNLNIKSYRIRLQAPISSLSNTSNFQEAEWEVEE